MARKISYERRAYSVEAMCFDGTFDLEFLQENERVTGGGAPGVCEVHFVDVECRPQVHRLEKGDWLVRDDGALLKLDNEKFHRLYEKFGVYA